MRTAIFQKIIPFLAILLLQYPAWGQEGEGQKDSTENTEQEKTEIVITIPALPREIIRVFAYGISSSFFASIIFFFVLYRLKPKVAISRQIARSIEQDKNGLETIVYTIKLVNMGRVDISNVKIALDKAVDAGEMNSQSGSQSKIKRVEITPLYLGTERLALSKELLAIPGLRRNSNNDDDAPYAVLVKIAHVLPPELKENQNLTLPPPPPEIQDLKKITEVDKDSYLIFSVYAVHALSGFGTLEEVKLKKSGRFGGNIVIDGEFQGGTSLTIDVDHTGALTNKIEGLL